MSMTLTVSDSHGLASVLRSLPNAVIAVDAQGRITLVNPVAERLFATRMAEVSGQPLRAIHVALGAPLERAM
jgi:PAS domain S-box-containing protein